jgi:hypothetical protein
MTTVITKVEKTKPSARTEFQFYATVKALASSNVTDFTEFKLLSIANTLRDKAKKEKVLLLLADYRGGKVAVAWTAGNPMFISITKD